MASLKPVGTLPPDRSHVSTERRHGKSTELDSLDTRGVIDLMIDDHRLVHEAVSAAAPALASFIDEVGHKMRAGGRLIYLGAGTSGRLGVLDASECPPTFNADPNQVIGIIAGGDSSLRESSEGKEDDPDGARDQLGALTLNSQDTVLGIAAGGTTPYVLGALSIAKASRAFTGLLTCAAVQIHPSDCDHLILIDTGPELLTGSTRLKAGSATKLALNIISTTLFIKLGKVYSNLMVDVRATNAKLIDRAVRILQEFDASLTRHDAQGLLLQAHGQLKAAIVMRKLNVPHDEALKILAQSQGILRNALAKRSH
jgi:N-acetylmuramic acid 6-phosphate etherase